MSQAAHFAWSEDRAPLLDSFLVVSTRVKHAAAGDLLRVARKAVVREGFSSVTSRVGNLAVGEVVVALETKEVNGQVRVRFRHRDEGEGKAAGWTSERSKRGDWLLMPEEDLVRNERVVEYHVSYPRKEAGAEDPCPATLEHFCLPTVAEAAGGADTAQYAFVRTLDSGQRQYGFCERVRRGGAKADTVEVTCLLSRYLWPSAFKQLLEAMSAQRSETLESADSFSKLGAIVDATYEAAAANFPRPGDSLTFKLPGVIGGIGGDGAFHGVDGTISFERPDDERDPMADIDYREAFQMLGVPGVMAVFQALLSEQRIVVISDDAGRLSDCMHGLLALMYPFRWQHIYVPLLPRMFLDYLTAPMPFVCGIHTSLKDEFERLPTEEDLVIVKLSTNEVELCGSVSGNLAPLPQSHMGVLKKKVTGLLRDYGIEAGSRKFRGNPAVFNRRISEAFIGFMVAIFGKYRDFITKDFEFDVEGFTAAADRTETTRVFLGTIRDLQLFEAWARERAALVKRAAAESPHSSPVAGEDRKEKFTLALYDKFEALVEVEGEFVGMNWVEKAYAKREKEQREAREKEARMLAKKQRVRAGQRRSSLDTAMGNTSSEKTPPGTPPNVCSTAVFQKDGVIGISWAQQKTDNAAVVKAVRPGTQAARIEGLCPGLVLTSVNGTAVLGLPYSEVIDLVRESERPLTLCFDPQHIQNQIVGSAVASHVDQSPERSPNGKPSNGKMKRLQSDPSAMKRLQSDPGVHLKLDRSNTTSMPDLLSPVGEAGEEQAVLSGRASVTGPPCISEGVPPADPSAGEGIVRGSRLDEPSAPPPWVSTAASPGDGKVMTKTVVRAGTETSFGMSITTELLIGAVKDGEAAARAGLCVGMQIVSVMGERVTAREQVLRILQNVGPKDPLMMELRHSTEQQPTDNVALLLAEAKELLRVHLENMEARADELRELKRRATALRAGEKQ